MRVRHFRYLLGTALTAIVGITGYSTNSKAVQLRDGTFYFNQPPRLVEAATTYNDVSIWGGTYYFTLSLPENAVEPLQRITINQHEGIDNIRFLLKDSYVFEGTRGNQGQKLTLQDITASSKTRTVSLILNPPVPPGKTITIAMKPVQNPTVSGVYLFGVTAYPAGEKSHGQFLGYGRLQFYSHF